MDVEKLTKIIELLIKYQLDQCFSVDALIKLCKKGTIDIDSLDKVTYADLIPYADINLELIRKKI
jgi:hypothetical protein